MSYNKFRLFCNQGSNGSCVSKNTVFNDFQHIDKPLFLNHITTMTLIKRIKRLFPINQAILIMSEGIDIYWDKMML